MVGNKIDNMLFNYYSAVTVETHKDCSFCLFVSFTEGVYFSNKPDAPAIEIFREVHVALVLSRPVTRF